MKYKVIYLDDQTMILHEEVLPVKQKRNTFTIVYLIHIRDILKINRSDTYYAKVVTKKEMTLPELIEWVSITQKVESRTFISETRLGTMERSSVQFSTDGHGVRIDESVTDKRYLYCSS